MITGNKDNEGNTDSSRLAAVIVSIRKKRVIVDSDLARLYGVKTKRLKEQVKRNSERFPDDFMFQITKKEMVEVVANCDHLRKLKYSSVFWYFQSCQSISGRDMLNIKIC